MGVRRTIPIYDATAPIVCTMSEVEAGERVQQLERLRHALRAVEPTDHGARLHFPDEPAVEDDLRRFAADEHRCCTFWGLAVDRDAGDLVLRWEAPPDARPLLDELLIRLTGDDPIESLTGLL